jgi:hypothetical protein
MVEAPSSNRLLCLGLELAGFKPRRIQRTRYKKNLSRFRSAYGVGPETVKQILNDLSLHGTEDEPDPVWLLIALNWMRMYNTEEFMEGVFDFDEKTIQEHVWQYILAIRKLKVVKVSPLHERNLLPNRISCTPVLMLFFDSCRSSGCGMTDKPMMVDVCLFSQLMVSTAQSMSLAKSPVQNGIHTSFISQGLLMK